MRLHPALGFALATLITTACGDDGADDASSPAGVRIVDGDGQRAAPGAPLARPLVIEVVDGRGLPVAGASVTFVAEDGGVVEPGIATTGGDGRAAAAWTLGEGVEPDGHRAQASVASVGAARFTAFQSLPAPVPPGDIRSLSLSTYDGSGQTVHPDVYELPVAASSIKSRLGLAITPYPFGDPAHENPSLYRGDGLSWLVPAGVVNPVARPSAGHLSDPDIVRDPSSGRLRLYYREASDRNRIWLVQSDDGVRWGAPRLVVEGANHTVLSPSVVRRREGEWLMWAVDGHEGCRGRDAHVTLRRSSDGARWSAPQRVQLDQPDFFPWHVEVQWIPELGEYWALYNGKTAGSCTTPALFLATSADGVTWTTYPSPVLVRGALPAFADIVYRATFQYDAATDVVTLWHSGARYEGGRYVWSSAVEARPRAQLFGQLNQPGTPEVPPGTPGAPPLEAFP